MLTGLAGPTLAACAITAATGGRPAVRRWLQRYIRWRVGLVWYLIALTGFLALFMLSATVAQGDAPATAVRAQWPQLFTSFLPNVAIFTLFGFLGEEGGWRGFALPRLKARYGPVRGTLLLGTLHGLWHLPAFFIVGALAPITWPLFLTFVLTAVGGSFLYTWLFNHTRGSILLAILTHAASNAASGFVSELAPAPPALAGDWPNVIVFGLAALLLIALTRGRLGHRPEAA